MNAAANIYLSHNPQSQAMKAVAARRHCIYNQYTSFHHHNEEGSSSRTQNNFASRTISKEKRSPRATSSLILSHLVHIIRSAREKILQVAATLFSQKISAAPALSFISSGSTIATVSSENLLFPISACGAQREKKENVASEMRKSQPCAFSFFFLAAVRILNRGERRFFPSSPCSHFKIHQENCNFHSGSGGFGPFSQCAMNHVNEQLSLFVERISTSSNFTQKVSEKTQKRFAAAALAMRRFFLSVSVGLGRTRLHPLASFPLCGQYSLDDPSLICKFFFARSSVHAHGERDTRDALGEIFKCRQRRSLFKENAHIHAASGGKRGNLWRRVSRKVSECLGPNAHDFNGCPLRRESLFLFRLFETSVIHRPSEHF
jgi:hypothetical protein